MPLNQPQSVQPTQQLLLAFCCPSGIYQAVQQPMALPAILLTFGNLLPGFQQMCHLVKIRPCQPLLNQQGRNRMLRFIQERSCLAQPEPERKPGGGGFARAHALLHAAAQLLRVSSQPFPAERQQLKDAPVAGLLTGGGIEDLLVDPRLIQATVNSAPSFPLWRERRRRKVIGFIIRLAAG